MSTEGEETRDDSAFLDLLAYITKEAQRTGDHRIVHLMQIGTKHLQETTGLIPTLLLQYGHLLTQEIEFHKRTGLTLEDEPE